MTDLMRNPPDYTAHAAFVRRAGNAVESWRTALGTGLFLLAFLTLPTLFAAFFLPHALRDDFFQGETAGGVLTVFAVMILPILALQKILRRLHNRGLWSLIGSPTDFVTQGIATIKVIFLTLVVIEIAPPWPPAETFSVIRPILPWLLILPLAVVAVGVQVLGEELFFRGYLQQQIAARTNDPRFWMWGPALLFGALHYFNADGPAEGVLWALWATGLGLACADLTARSGSLGPAVGLHLVNNLFALLLYGMETGPVSGLALFLSPYVDPATIDQSLSQLASPGGVFQILLIGLEITVLWVAARLAIRR